MREIDEIERELLIKELRVAYWGAVESHLLLEIYVPFLSFEHPALWSACAVLPCLSDLIYMMDQK